MMMFPSIKQLVKVKSCSIMSNSLKPHGPDSQWNSTGQNTGVGSLSFLQGLFPTQGSNTCSPHCRRILCQLQVDSLPAEPQIDT